MRPETRCARSGEVHLAYQTIGDGPLDVVLVDQWWSNVDAQWELRPLARLLERVASFARVILLDKRGTGLSDPVPLGGMPTLEEWMDGAVGLEIRCGLHTGELQVADGDVRGIAVHIGARIAALAGAGEILVSATVKDLVIGSGIAFEDRGIRQLKGVPDEWHLYRAEV
jgi:hypothetical protein